jgi:hypothetical protein
MVYNEAVFLPIWARYYASALGVRNLTVLDHGSDDGSLDRLPPGIGVVTLPRTPLDENTRASAVNAFAATLRPYYDVVIYTDCDEIIVPDPDRYPGGLSEYCERCPALVAPIGLDVIHAFDREEPLDLHRPILRQRRFCRFESMECKPLITKRPVSWSPGFHFADQPWHVAHDAYLFHLKVADRDIALRRLELTRTITWSEANLARRVAVHQRERDDQFLDRYFTSTLALLQSGADLTFSFRDDVARLSKAIEESGERRTYPAFFGKVARRPKHFRDFF